MAYNRASATLFVRYSINALTRQTFKIDSRVADSYLIRPSLFTYVRNSSITDRDFRKCNTGILSGKVFSLFYNLSNVENIFLKYICETKQSNRMNRRANEVVDLSINKINSVYKIFAK